MKGRGLISFVGAGPGAADLITLRAQDRLAKADVIVYAGSLVPKAVLIHARSDCEKVSSASLVLDDIVALMRKAADQGQKVVRLHSGDTSIYSALSEQWDRLKSDRFDREIIPGVPAFAAVAAAAEMELTRPGSSQSIILTRPGQDGSSMPKNETLERLAQHKTSLCLHLAGKRLLENMDRLITIYGDDCPCVLASQVSWPDEMIYQGRFADVRKQAAKAPPRRAVMLMLTPRTVDHNQSSALYDAGYNHASRPR